MQVAAGRSALRSAAVLASRTIDSRLMSEYLAVHGTVLSFAHARNMLGSQLTAVQLLQHVLGQTDTGGLRSRLAATNVQVAFLNHRASAPSCCPMARQPMIPFMPSPTRLSPPSPGLPTTRATQLKFRQDSIVEKRAHTNEHSGVRPPNIKHNVEDFRFT